MSSNRSTETARNSVSCIHSGAPQTVEISPAIEPPMNQIEMSACVQPSAIAKTASAATQTHSI